MLDGFSAIDLARFQFAFTISAHIVFPAFTIGLASFLAVLNGLWPLILGAVLLQFVLGVFTVLTQVQLVLGVLHQQGALVLLAVLLVALHRTGRAIPS